MTHCPRCAAELTACPTCDERHYCAACRACYGYAGVLELTSVAQIERRSMAIAKPEAVPALTGEVITSTRKAGM